MSVLWVGNMPEADSELALKLGLKLSLGLYVNKPYCSIFKGLQTLQVD